MKVYLIQNTPTAHINEMVNSLEKDGLQTKVFYATSNGEDHHNRNNYYSKKINFEFIKKIFYSNGLVIITGWMNINMIVLNILFFVTQKKYFYWTDRPSKVSSFSFASFKRLASILIMRYSNSFILCVGKTAQEYFQKKGFNKSRLINYPILTSCLENKIDKNKKVRWRKVNFKIEKDMFLISSGSRLEYEKGYDLLLKAVFLIEDTLKEKIKLIIVGNGSQKNNLKELAGELNLTNNIIFLDWQEIEYFKEIIAHSDLFIHPSRYDAYGASIYPLALGVPVLGSSKAGVIIDRVIDGFNGLVFDPENLNDFKSKIEKLILNNSLISKLGNNALSNSKLHQPNMYAKTLKKYEQKFY
mgnify:CR=1 FL=1